MNVRPLPAAVLALFLFACGGGATDPGSDTSGDEASPAALSAVQQLNASAREGAVTESLHGVEVADPFRSLEEDSEATRSWIDAQTARSQALLDANTDPTAAQRLDALLSIGVIGAPVVAGDRTFYTKRDGDGEQPALYLRQGDTLLEEPIIDPATYGERAALDGFDPSPSGRYVAFRISTNGDERSTLRILDVDEGEVLDEAIEHTKWSSVTWLHSEDGFYYRRYPREGEPGWDAELQDVYHMRLFFHALGTDEDGDAPVFSPEQNTDFPGASISANDRWLIINNFRGWSASDVYLFDRGRLPRLRRISPDEAHPLVEVVVGQEHLYSASMHRGRVYISHNDGAPRYRIEAVAPEHAAERDAWTVVVPEGEGAIEGYAYDADRIIVHTIEGVASRVRTYGLDGSAGGEIELPGRGELFGLDADPENGRVALGFSSFVYPPALFSWSAPSSPPTGTGALVELDRVETDFDFDSIRLSQASVRSADGTEINVYYVHRADMEPNGEQRVLLYGYGGFNVSLLPGFQRNALYWVERGGVYAAANIRGGGEFGEDWHRAGNLGNKERVFEDFEAVIGWLGGQSGISRPERIGIMGGSNGGLLMGAMVTRVPETFRVALAGVGLYDMVRYHRFPPAELWISEYGSADDEAQFAWLHAYSPYHHVVDSAPYPAVLITTADHDSRVHWAHSTKFTARLQEATGEPDPSIYFYMVRQVGHGAGTRRSDTVDRYVRTYTFLEHFIGRPGS